METINIIQVTYKYNKHHGKWYVTDYKNNIYYYLSKDGWSECSLNLSYFNTKEQAKNRIEELKEINE